MSDATKGEQQSSLRVVLLQLVLSGAVAAVFAALKGQASAVAALYGGLIAMANALILSWFWLRAEQRAGTDVQRNIRYLFGSAATRFAAVVTLFALGLGPWQLAPLPLMVGFIAGQAALLIRWI